MHAELSTCPVIIHKAGTCCAEALLKRARNIVAEYALVGVPQDRFLLRIPATWEGIQAAGQLEAEGVATHLVLVYRCARVY